MACKKTYRVVSAPARSWWSRRDRCGCSSTIGTSSAHHQRPHNSWIGNCVLANDRCDQENLIGQLKGGVKALAMPVDNLVSNWAYMVMASLAWSLKAWSALVLPEQGRWAEKYRSEKRSLLRLEFQDILRGHDPGAMSDRQDSRSDRLPPAVMEPMARCVPTFGGAVARSPVVLTSWTSEAGVWKLRSIEAWY